MFSLEQCLVKSFVHWVVCLLLLPIFKNQWSIMNKYSFTLKRDIITFKNTILHEI